MKTRVLIFIFSIFCFFACFQQNEDFYFNDLFVEFNEVSLSTNPESFQILIMDNVEMIKAQVNLVGVHQSEDQTISFSIASESTAIEGLHYNLNASSCIIPAYSSFGYIEFSILKDAILPGESVNLTLILEGNEKILPSENYKKQKYTLLG